jgi:hypothetical protein
MIKMSSLVKLDYRLGDCEYGLKEIWLQLCNNDIFGSILKTSSFYDWEGGRSRGVEALSGKAQAQLLN